MQYQFKNFLLYFRFLLIGFSDLITGVHNHRLGCPSPIYFDWQLIRMLLWLIFFVNCSQVLIGVERSEHPKLLHWLPQSLFQTPSLFLKVCHTLFHDLFTLIVNSRLGNVLLFCFQVLIISIFGVLVLFGRTSHPRKFKFFASLFF